MGKTTFIAAGDAFITRRLPEGGYPGCGLGDMEDFRKVRMSKHEKIHSGYAGSAAQPRNSTDCYGF